MENQSLNAKEAAMLGQIKSILLKDDRQEIDAIKKTLYTKEELAKEVSPILEDRIQNMRGNFRKEFGESVDKIVESKLEESKEQLLNVIYPVLGQMIRKFVNYQFQLLKDRIDNQVNSVFSTRGILGEIKSKVFGIRSSDIVLSDLDKPMIEEVYVIQRDSGLLLGSFSRKVTVDKDMIAGMLTAIKSFVQDAFQQEKQELELIEYGSYKILIQNFFSYYISVAVTGSLSTSERDVISENLLEFAEDKMPNNLQVIDTELQNKVSEGLEAFFSKDIFEE